jgi:threonine aldolase
MLGIQFDVLFKDGLYLRIARHAVDLAVRLREAMVAKGYEVFIPTPTNQLFFALTAEQLEKVSKVTTYSEWEHLSDGRTVIRLATSWATRGEDVDALIAAL